MSGLFRSLIQKMVKVRPSGIGAAVISCCGLRFGVELLNVRVREAAITICRDGRLFGPNASPGALARRDRAHAGGAPALPGDRISPRPPREFLIGRSNRARFLGA